MSGVQQPHRSHMVFFSSSMLYIHVRTSLAANGIMASIAVGNTCATASGSKSDGIIIVLCQLQNSSVCTSGASFLVGKEA